MALTIAIAICWFGALLSTAYARKRFARVGFVIGCSVPTAIYLVQLGRYLTASSTLFWVVGAIAALLQGGILTLAFLLRGRTARVAAAALSVCTSILFGGSIVFHY